MPVVKSDETWKHGLVRFDTNTVTASPVPFAGVTFDQFNVGPARHEGMGERASDAASPDD